VNFFSPVRQEMRKRRTRVLTGPSRKRFQLTLGLRHVAREEATPKVNREQSWKKGWTDLKSPMSLAYEINRGSGSFSLNQPAFAFPQKSAGCAENNLNLPSCEPVELVETRSLTFCFPSA
jgi:hypothetical protein